jgi:hypothetical protein
MKFTETMLKPETFDIFQNTVDSKILAKFVLFNVIPDDVILQLMWSNRSKFTNSQLTTNSLSTFLKCTVDLLIGIFWLNLSVFVLSARPKAITLCGFHCIWIHAVQLSPVNYIINKNNLYNQIFIFWTKVVLNCLPLLPTLGYSVNNGAQP